MRKPIFDIWCIQKNFFWISGYKATSKSLHLFDLDEQLTLIRNNAKGRRFESFLY